MGALSTTNFAVRALGPHNPKSRALLLHHAVIARSSCLPIFSCAVDSQSVEQTNCTLLHSMICIILMTSVASWQPSGWIYCSLGTVICPHPSRFPTASRFLISLLLLHKARLPIYSFSRYAATPGISYACSSWRNMPQTTLKISSVGQMPRFADKFHPRCPCPLHG